MNIHELSKKLEKLEQTGKNQETYRILIYNATEGAPKVQFNDTVLMLPDNGRDTNLNMRGGEKRAISGICMKARTGETEIRRGY